MDWFWDLFRIDKMLELRLRHWLKDTVGEDHMQWVEPARGSSVGVGDAIIKTPRGGDIPVELKIWKYTTKGLCCEMRPSQIRYHYMTWYRSKGRTAIIFAVDHEIYVLAGQYVPKDKYKNVVAEKMIHLGSIIGQIEISKSDLFRGIVRAFNK